MPGDLLEHVATAEQLLALHASALGAHQAAYRYHVYRVINFCHAQVPCDGERLEKVAIAAACHDLGIWTDRTFDYLDPSLRLATRYLSDCGRQDWSGEVGQMIVDHHKLTASASAQYPLVEVFRRADWLDISRGSLRFGVPRTRVRQILSRWPNAGFHRFLLRLALKEFRSHPLRPLPMVRG